MGAASQHIAQMILLGVKVNKLSCRLSLNELEGMLETDAAAGMHGTYQ